MLHVRNERAPLPPARPEKPTATPAAVHRTSGGRPGAGRAGQRDPFLDNAKYLTILLVGMGHAWQPLQEDSRAAEALYLTVYAFHMPAFIVISGYLSRTFTGRPAQVRRLMTGIAVPYVVFETVYTLFMRWADDPEREFSLQRPGFALWFLVALFIWRMTTPLWHRLRWPLPVALVIGVLASVTRSISGDFDLMRVLQFLPFFVLGLQLKPRHLGMLQDRRLRRLSVPLLLGTLGFSYWAARYMNTGWLLHTDSAAEMGVPEWVGITMYLALFGCALVLTAAFLTLVPRRRTWFTTLGAGTLYAYLLHVYPIKISREFDWYGMAWVDHPVSRVAITLLALVMMTVLCTPPVQRAFRFVMEPRMSWFFREEPPRQDRAPEQKDGEPAPGPGSRGLTRDRSAAAPGRR